MFMLNYERNMLFGRTYFALQLLYEAELADREESVMRKRRNRRDVKSVKRRRSFSMPRISDAEFVERYQLSKEAFKFLCTSLRENTNLRRSQRNSLETKVLSALSFYASGDFQRQVGVANALSQEVISRYIHQVTKALNTPNFVKKFVNFPNTTDTREIVKENFQKLYGIPGVVGCVDCCHFRILRPRRDVCQLYRCRDHYYSLNVQMIADSECRILAMNPMFGGHTEDSLVWEASKMNDYMQTLHQNGESVWLLGDLGYPQRPWLMTPYQDPSPNTPAESYNNAHSKALTTIEKTITRLKNRWRCLSKEKGLHYVPEKCAEIIIACSVLHNIALQFGVPDPEETITDNRFHRNVIYEEVDKSLLTQGHLMRDGLATKIHSAID